METALDLDALRVLAYVGHAWKRRRNFMVITVIDGKISVPFWVVDIDSFRRWTDCDDFPEKGQVWWLRGEVWADMSKEQIFSHLGIKREYYYVLTGIVKSAQSGLFLPDGLLLSNFAADISGNPDATFITNETLRSDRIRLLEGKEGGYVEIQGSPDMVLEIVSDSSEQKDLVLLKQAYWDAGIREYWIVDVRAGKLQFDILHSAAKGFAKRRKKAGWVDSEVCHKAFRLAKSMNALGHPEFTLETR
jgi:Uma2 family endonuclease